MCRTGRVHPFADSEGSRPKSTGRERKHRHAYASHILETGMYEVLANYFFMMFENMNASQCIKY